MTKWVLNWRTWGLIACSLWGCYFVTLWRTTDFGVSWRGVLADTLAFLCFVLPFAASAVLGLPWRKAGVTILAIGVGSVLAAEVFAGAQELVVIWSYGQNPGREMFVVRWPPYGDHHIGYSPGYGWFGDD